MIQEEAFRCKSITEKLLDFSRCNDITRERTDLAGLIQGVVEMIRHIGKYRGKNDRLPPPRGRDGPRRQPGDQAGRAEPHRQRPRVDGPARARCGSTPDTTDGMAEMAFADDGCGMEPDVLENIFEPFFTRRREGKGTGLGLSITHRIISQHDGEIMAVSPGAGQGSTFTVRLPIHPAEITDDGPVRSRRPGRRRAEPAAGDLIASQGRPGPGRMSSGPRRVEHARSTYAKIGRPVAWKRAVREDCESCSRTMRPTCAT